jgi:hypothetical protein
MSGAWRFGAVAIHATASRILASAGGKAPDSSGVVALPKRYHGRSNLA